MYISIKIKSKNVSCSFFKYSSISSALLNICISEFSIFLFKRILSKPSLKKILSVWLSSTIPYVSTIMFNIEFSYVSTIMFNIEFSYPIPTHCNCVYSTTFLKSKSSSFFLVLLLLFSEPEDDLLPVSFEELFPLLLPVFPVELLP